MLDYLRADDAVEGAVAKRQRECGTAQQRNPPPPQKAQLTHAEIQPHRVVQALDDDARPTSHVEHAFGSTRPGGRYAMPLALPVALDGDETIKGALVVVGRSDGVAQLP